MDERVRWVCLYNGTVNDGRICGMSRLSKKKHADCGWFALTPTVKPLKVQPEVKENRDVAPGGVSYAVEGFEEE